MKLMKWVLLVVALPMATSTAFAQSSGNSTTPERSRSTTGFYVDEVGLRMSMQIPFEGTIDAATYVVGAMDAFTIEAKGAAPFIWKAISVNSQGILVVPNVGSVSVGGLSLNEAISSIQTMVGQQFRSSTVNVFLEAPKQMNIHVAGDVISPGRYVFPPQTRVDVVVAPAILGAAAFVSSINDNEDDDVQAGDATRAPVIRAVDLYSSTTGGIPRQYNLRDVEIRRSNGTVLSADLLSYFYSGNLSSNPFVNDGDIITVYRKSQTTPRVSISGAVRMPLEFEYRADDTLQRLLAIAGGLVEHSDEQDVRIHRTSGSGERMIRLTTSDDLPLQPNDRVVIGSKQERLGKNVSAWISGEVNTPGNYPIVEGTTSVYDLLNAAEGTTPDALKSGAYLERSSVSIQSQILKDYDQLWLRRSSDQLSEGFQYLSEEQFFSGRFMFINLADESRLKELILVDGDRLFVPRNKNTVFVFGQVNLTGYYAHQSGLTAQDYVKNAGGTALAADTERVFIIKAGSRTWHRVGSIEIEPGDMVFVDRVPYDDIQSKRQFELTVAQQRNNNYALILSTIATISSIITTAILISR
jgi:protein involved in polysaccharide export with SLBB domain